MTESAAFILILVIFFLILGAVGQQDYEDELRLARIYKNLEAEREANDAQNAYIYGDASIYGGVEDE